MTWNAQGKYVFDGADCIGIFDTDNYTDKNMEGKARMAAAAPDLLEALVALVDSCVLAHDADFPQGSDPLTIARAAIAKAKGQTNA